MERQRKPAATAALRPDLETSAAAAASDKRLTPTFCQLLSIQVTQLSRIDL
jgi:hypothetical protein